ncbi:MAG TPA: methyltransferase [Kiritimatiellia bacterium]|nr:methyltransferase [Kiritimatiellia bacterium]
MKADKELYRKLRALSCDELWNVEVPRFNRADPKERNARVAVIRAVGVAFSAAGSVAQRAEVKAWLAGLLNDPSEKVRRYAMAAIPKLRGAPGAENRMVELLKRPGADREKRHIGRALEKIGGPDALQAVSGVLPQTEQKVKAALARVDAPSEMRLDRVFEGFNRLRVHLRCRRGLEGLVREELAASPLKSRFRLLEQHHRCLVLTPTAPFTLADVYQLRCFATLGFSLGYSKSGDLDELAAFIVSPRARVLMQTFTEGSVRYRIEFMDKGHQRGAVRELANRAYARCPDMLNDAREAPWSMDLHATPRGMLVELRPRIHPDPRFTYRRGDVSASSHPPLAAAMARLAGPMDGEVAWDPFCGSGVELIERGLLGGVARLIGTDVSPEAVATARRNVAAASLGGVETVFMVSDFRAASVAPGSVSLVISNPPMGRRIRIKDMRGLYADFFTAASRALRPGGRLVFPNPLRIAPADASLVRDYQQPVDLGGYLCRLERYRKA